MRIPWSAVSALLCLAVCRPVSADEFPGLPLPENSAIVLAVVAEGVQIYESKTNPSGGFQWSLKAPDAELKKLSGEIIGHHGAGPSWSLTDGSSIVGNSPPIKNIAAPGNIPWLLVAVKSRNGSGILDKADYVMRIATEGGAAPTEPPKAEGETTNIKYRAIYLFVRKS